MQLLVSVWQQAMVEEDHRRVTDPGGTLRIATATQNIGALEANGIWTASQPE